MISRLTLLLLLFLHTVAFAQLLYKPVIVHNGFEDGKLVRNHVEIQYTHHTASIISGSIVVSYLQEYAHSQPTATYDAFLQKDTLASFYGTITKGKKEGTFVSGPEGNIITIHTYHNNVLEGPFESFYTFGQLYKKGVFKKGQQAGDFKQYYANGKPARFVYTNGINDYSEQEYYYVNGQLESKGALYRGQKVNEWIYYDFKGKLKKTEYYGRKGKLLKTIR